MERARAARLHEEPEQRLPRPKLILSVAWRTKRDTLRAFHLALVPAKAMYGIAVWHWGASPASRSTPKSAQYQKSKMISGIPKGSRMEDAALETEPRPLPDVVLGRRFRCELLCETHGSALRPIVPLRMAPTNPRHQACSRWIARRFRRKNPLPHPEGKHHEARTDSSVEPGVESGAAAMPCLNGTPISAARVGAGST
ncbi:hypothetical protein TcBrA4_0075290 [Trypanosoma cruzi]|nr:hypothetical protein TcBrA4_0075290 [Trypanosoma cruzi]